MSRSNRKFFSAFQVEDNHLKYGMLYICFGLFCLIVLNGALLYSFKPALGAGSAAYLSNMSNLIQNGIWPILILMLLVEVFLILATLIISRNVVGPQVALSRHIEALKNGNYEHKTQLRKNDSLKGIMNGLNELSDVLSQKQ